jgi:VanZ family protein
LIYKSISWIAVVLWMAFIFYLSAQVAEQSNNLSTGITEIIIEVVEKVVPEKELDIKTVNHFVRKNAHFFAYFMLGILVVNALTASGVKGFKGIVIAFLICVLYAVSDLSSTTALTILSN